MTNLQLSRVERSPTNSRSSVNRQLSHAQACSFQRAMGMPVPSPSRYRVYISVCDKHVPLLPSRNSLTLLHQTRQTGAELIWINRYRPTNHCTSVIARCILGSMDESRADNLRDYLRTFWHVENLRDYQKLSEGLSERKSFSCNGTIHSVKWCQVISDENCWLKSSWKCSSIFIFATLVISYGADEM